MTSDKDFPSVEGFERRDSIRRYSAATITFGKGKSLDVKVVLSLQGAFVENGRAVPEEHFNTEADIWVDLGALGTLRGRCHCDGPPPARPHAGIMFSWRALDFEAERALARFLDADRDASADD